MNAWCSMSRRPETCASGLTTADREEEDKQPDRLEGGDPTRERYDHDGSTTQLYNAAGWDAESAHLLGSSRGGQKDESVQLPALGFLLRKSRCHAAGFTKNPAFIFARRLEQ